MPASTLEGRLLCASGAAYAIDGTSSVLADDPANFYIAGAGFLRPPTLLFGGVDDIDACLVGETADGFVVAFRGTLSFDLHSIPTLRDWLVDFQAQPVAVAGFPGFIHRGFAGALAVLSPMVVAELEKQRASSSPDRAVFVTGHSKGGAVAALAAWGLRAAGFVLGKVVTFASAKPADATFSRAYNAAGIDHVRYEYADDIVPHLPLSTGGFIDVLSHLPVIGRRFTVLDRFDYQPVGALLYIEENGSITPDTATLRSTRDLSLAMEIVAGRLPQIAADHAIGCGSGYMKAVAPTGVCPPPGL